MKNILYIIAFLASTVLHAQDINNIQHDVMHHVDDFAHIFRPEEIKALDNLITPFFDTVQIQLITITSTGQQRNDAIVNTDQL